MDESPNDAKWKNPNQKHYTLNYSIYMKLQKMQTNLYSNRKWIGGYLKTGVEEGKITKWNKESFGGGG